MEVKDLTTRISDLQQRLSHLQEDVAAGHIDAREAFAEMSEELATSMEELLVAEEELSVQNEELEAAREMLTLERRRYMDLFANAPDGYLVTDTKGMIQDANRIAADLFGVQLNFLIGMPLVNYVPVERRDELREYMRQLREGERNTVKDVDLELKREDGPSVFVSLHTSAVWFGGYVLDLRWLLRDITRRKQAEMALSESEERLRLLSDVTDEGIVIHDKGKILDANEALARMFGFGSVSEIIGKSGFVLMTPESQELLRQHVATESDEPYDAVGIRKDGIHFPIEIRGRNIEYKRAKVRAGVVRDLTERKRAEEALRNLNALLEAERARWQGVVEGIADEVWVCDDHGKMSLINLPDITAMGLEEFEDKTIHEVLEDVDIYYTDGTLRPPEEAPLLHSLRTGEIVRGEEIMHYRRTGKTRYRQFSCAPTRDAATSKVTGAVAIVRDITDRKQMEEELRHQRAHLRQIIDLDPNFIFAKDREGRFTLVNQAVADTYGTTVEDLIGKTDADFDPNTEEVEFFRLKDLEVMDSGEPRLIPEERITDAAGNLRWLQTVKIPFMMEDGQATQILGVSTDITARKRAEDAMRESESRYRQLVELAPILIAVHQDGQLVYANPAALKLLSVKDPQSVMGRPILSFVHPDYQEAVRERISLMLQNHDVPHLEEKFFREDGSAVDVDVHAAPMTYQGKPAVLIMAQDVTERKRAENALRRSEALLKEAGEMANLGAWWIDFTSNREDINDNPLGWSDQTYRIFGYEPGEIEATNDLFFQRVHPEDRDLVRAAVANAIAEHKSYEVEHRIIRPDGAERFVSERAEIRYDEQGRPTAIIGAVQDITERKQIETRLQEINEELTRSNSELERFAYVASHDMQEPLRMVSSYLKLLEKRYRGKLDSNADDFINFAMEGALRMQSMVHDLLELSRIQTRGRPFMPFEVQGALDQALANLTMVIRENQAEITTDPLPSIWGDETQFVQLFQNLLENAIKYRREEPPKVHVSVRRERRDWIFSVKDNGIGIDPNQFDRIFLIFQRLHRADQYSGTGIGLSVVKKIVERHGGRIWVESQPGQGATFYFTVPATQRG